jgi:hypothetical protein
MKISINSGSWGKYAIRLVIDFWGIGKGGTKKGCRKMSGLVENKWVTAGFCGPCMCLGVFLLL